MILNEQLTYIRDKFISTSWSNPGLETNLYLIPTLLTCRFQANTSFDVMGMAISMPDSENLYELYTFQYVPTEIFKMSEQYVDVWVRLDEFCSYNNSLIYLSYGTALKTVRYLETYICYLSNGALLLATKYDTDLSPYRNDLSVMIRSSNDTLNVDIDVVEVVCKTSSDVDKIVTEYNSATNPDDYLYLIDGVFNKTINASVVKVGTNVTKIKDSSLTFISDQPLPTLKSYTANGLQYYLVDLAMVSDDVRLFSFRDASLWVMNGDIGRRLIFLDSKDIVQVTNTIVGIGVDYLENLTAKLLWTMDECTLRVNTKRGDPQQEYVNNDNYWRALNSIDYETRLRALSKEIDSVDVLTAAWQQDSDYIKLLDTQYTSLTLDSIDNALSVSTWDYYVNRPVYDAAEFDNNIITLPPSKGKMLTVVAYHDGYPTEFYPKYITDTTSAVHVAYQSEYHETHERVVNLDKYTIAAAYDITDRDHPILLAEGDGYTTLDNSIRIDADVGRSCVIDLASTYFENRKFGYRSISIEDMTTAIGSVTLIYSGEILTPMVDYFHDSEVIIIWKADVPDDATITVIYQPTILTGGGVVEYGFIYDNRINISGNYLAFDPSNYYIVHDGRMYLPEQVGWKDPFVTSNACFTNGKPFAVVKPLISNTDDVTETAKRRIAYDDKLDAISDFKNMHTEFPQPDWSLYSERYGLVSIFMSEIVNSIEAGEIDIRPIAVANFGLNTILKDHLPILEKNQDPTKHELDWSVIELRGHSGADPKPIGGDAYMFLEKVNKAYLDSKVQMNLNFRIID